MLPFAKATHTMPLFLISVVFHKEEAKMQTWAILYLSLLPVFQVQAELRSGVPSCPSGFQACSSWRSRISREKEDMFTKGSVIMAFLRLCVCLSWLWSNWHSSQVHRIFANLHRLYCWRLRALSFEGTAEFFEKSLLHRLMTVLNSKLQNFFFFACIETYLLSCS